MDSTTPDSVSKYRSEQFGNHLAKHGYTPSYYHGNHTLYEHPAGHTVMFDPRGEHGGRWSHHHAEGSSVSGTGHHTLAGHLARLHKGDKPIAMEETEQFVEGADTHDVHKLLSKYGYGYKGKGIKGMPHVWEHPKGHEVIMAGGHSKDLKHFWVHTGSGGKNQSQRQGHSLKELEEHLKGFHSSQHAETEQFAELRDVLTKHGWRKRRPIGGGSTYQHGNHGGHNIHIMDDNSWQHTARELTLNKGNSSRDLNKHLAQFHSSQHAETGQFMEPPKLPEHRHLLAKKGWSFGGGPGYELHTHSKHPLHYIRVKGNQFIHGVFDAGGKKDKVYKAGGVGSLGNHLEEFHSSQHSEEQIPDVIQYGDYHIDETRAEEIVQSSRVFRGAAGR